MLEPRDPAVVSAAMEPTRPDAAKFVAAQEKIPAAVQLLESAQDLLKEVGELLPDPSGKVELERDLDPQLDIDPVEAGVVARCVSQDYLRPAIDDLKDLLRPSETGEGGDMTEEAVA